MKLKFNLLAGAVIVGGLSLSAWAQPDAVQPAAQTTKVPAKELAAKATVSDSWDSIKDYTYGKRDAFAASLERMAGILEVEVREMNAKVTGLTESAAKERDNTNKEFAEAHTYLKSLLADLRTGTADTWDNAKEKVARSWDSVQAAYEKVKASPTS